jgi:hypothetical protein
MIATAALAPIPVEVDPALETAAVAALSEWHTVTGISFRTVIRPTEEQHEAGFRFAVGQERPHLARTYAEAGHSTMRFDLEYASELYWIDAEALRRAALHELGHAIGLRFDPFVQETGETDTWHYRGSEPSVMKTDALAAAPHLGRPEVEAYFAKVERTLPR